MLKPLNLIIPPQNLTATNIELKEAKYYINPFHIISAIPISPMDEEWMEVKISGYFSRFWVRMSEKEFVNYVDTPVLT